MAKPPRRRASVALRHKFADEVESRGCSGPAASGCVAGGVRRGDCAAAGGMASAGVAAHAAALASFSASRPPRVAMRHAHSSAPYAPALEGSILWVKRLWVIRVSGPRYAGAHGGAAEYPIYTIYPHHSLYEIDDHMTHSCRTSNDYSYIQGIRSGTGWPTS